jgi:hypothetical protein
VVGFAGLTATVLPPMTTLEPPGGTEMTTPLRVVT